MIWDPITGLQANQSMSYKHIAQYKSTRDTSIVDATIMRCASLDLVQRGLTRVWLHDI